MESVELKNWVTRLTKKMKMFQMAGDYPVVVTNVGCVIFSIQKMCSFQLIFLQWGLKNVNLRDELAIKMKWKEAN